MKIKNLFLISFLFLSFSSFASTAKRVTEMDTRRFFGSIPIYYKNKNSLDPKRRELSEYAADLFAQYFALANKVGGLEMEATLRVIYNEKEYPTAANELIERGKAEARRQGIQLLNIRGSK